MPTLHTSGIVCSVRAHGEYGVIARLLTPDQGLVAGYVRGGRSSRMRPVLLPGNRVEAEFRARTADQLASLTAELSESLAPWHGEPLPAAAIAWSTALTAATLPEEQGYPRLHLALGALLDAICHAPSARRWVRALLGYEILLLRELGYGAGTPPGEAEDWPALMDAMRRSGLALDAHLFAGRRDDALAARDRLVALLRRAVA